MMQTVTLLCCSVGGNSFQFEASNEVTSEEWLCTNRVEDVVKGEKMTKKSESALMKK